MQNVRKKIDRVFDSASRDPSGAECRILLVEHDIRFQHMIKDTILPRYSSTQLSLASSDDEALRDVHRRCPDLILIDLELPATNGLGLVKRIKSLCPRAFVIAFSACDSPDLRKTALRGGAHFFLVKEPTSPDTVFKLIDAIIKRLTSRTRGAHEVACWYCQREFDVLNANWCGCGVNVDRPSKACPYCLRCMCSHPDYGNEELWGRISQSMKDYGFERLFYLYL
jgi:CheY-like chemotaxis protein